MIHCLPRTGVELLSALLIAGAVATVVRAEEPTMNAGTLAHHLDRLAHTGRILYIAAHPDDENTRLLAYLANNRHVGAAYLSMTRGGGGQNLIGTEQDQLLDVIRTEELLAARRMDGARQYFTRMRDFGYSKAADETLRIWGHDEALSDVVRVIRTFQPDVILARFDEQPPNHGHHTASAILAREAFTAAADPLRFPEQLGEGLAVWQAERLLLNVPTWREGPPPSDALALDVGAYDPRLGLGYGELAARSRSQHKSQGFGVAGERGPIVERFVIVAGSRPTTDILDGVKLGWERYGKPAAPLVTALNEARHLLDRDQPERALPALIEARRGLAALPDDPRVVDARSDIDQVIAGAAGLFVRATAAQANGVAGGTVPIEVEVIQRRPATITLERIEFPGSIAVEEPKVLGLNEKMKIAREVTIAADAAVSSPYWLAQPSVAGRQVVANPKLVGRAEGLPPLTVSIELKLGEQGIRLTTPVVFAWTDPVHGERVRSFLIKPPATITPVRHAIMLANGKPGSVAVRVRSSVADLRGEVVLPLPAGWRADPARAPLNLARAGDETTVRFQVSGPENAEPIAIAPALEIAGQRWSYREDVIDYPHIPMQVVLQPASVRLVPVTLRLPKGKVGYVPGPGDTVAEDLAHVGLVVETLDDETLRGGDLTRYSAIVVGIRAYNAREIVRGAHDRLMRWVEEGGTLVVQYTTNNRLSPLQTPIGPFPLTIGRERITDETAEMVAVDPNHPVLREPNKIGASDFADWVQERGLYYAESWDDRYQPIFSSADPGEKQLRGGVLVAEHGRGRYVYTGLSFFRQLPAGVPGAYRLFANLIAGR